MEPHTPRYDEETQEDTQINNPISPFPNILQYNQYVVCMLGKTGSGKSRLCQVLSMNAEQQFKSYNTLKSGTQEVSIKKNLCWFDSVPGLTLIDVPGAGDSECRDQAFLNQIYENIQKIGEIHSFILVIDGSSRADKSLWEMISIYKLLLGKEHFWKHVIVVVTHMDFNPYNHETLKDYQDDLNAKVKEFQQEFKIRLGQETQRIVAVSLMQEKKGKEIPKIWQVALKMGLNQIKSMIVNSQNEIYQTINLTKILTQETLQKYSKIIIKRTKNFEQQLENFIKSSELFNFFAKFYKQLIYDVNNEYISTYEEFENNYAKMILNFIAMKSQQILRESMEDLLNDLNLELDLNQKKIYVISPNEIAQLIQGFMMTLGLFVTVVITILKDKAQSLKEKQKNFQDLFLFELSNENSQWKLSMLSSWASFQNLISRHLQERKQIIEGK